MLRIPEVLATLKFIVSTLQGTVEPSESTIKGSGTRHPQGL